MTRWIVVADSTLAEIFEDRGGRLEFIDELAHAPSREHNQDLMGNRPNKNQHQGEKGLKGDEADSLREDESDRFSKDLAEYLRLAAARNKFDDLVLVTDPRTLGRLRDDLDATVRKLISGTVAKRALQMKPDEVMELVSEATP